MDAFGITWRGADALLSELKGLTIPTLQPFSGVFLKTATRTRMLRRSKCSVADGVGVECGTKQPKRALALSDAQPMAGEGSKR